MHDTDLVYVSCDAKWHFSDCGDTWTLHHFGSHNHAAPFASSPSQLGLHQIEEIIRNNPNMTPVQLVAGRCGRRTTTPTSKLDPKGFHRDFVSKIRGDVNEREFQKESGSKSGLGPHHLDATFHYFDEHHQKEKELYVLDGRIARGQAIHIASATMCREIQRAANPWQSDTVEGFVDAKFYKGQMNVTMTSSWENNQQTQQPLLFSILFDKTTHSYKMHFKTLFKLYARRHQFDNRVAKVWTKELTMKTIEDFLRFFPGMSRVLSLLVFTTPTKSLVSQINQAIPVTFPVPFMMVFSWHWMSSAFPTMAGS